MKKWHLWLAASIGLVVIVGMMIREFDVEVLSRIDLSPRFFLGVVMGVLLFAVQNLMLTLRFRHLCQRKLSVAEAFRINVLCEFTSAVTPSAVGGSGLAFVYLNREGVSMGRSIFTMFAALLADEAFLAISCVLLYFCVPSHLLFSLADGVGIPADATNEWIKGGVQVIFIVSTLIVAVWTAILYLLLLHRPQFLGWVLKGCCKIPFLRRFMPKVEKFSEEMTMASEEAKLEGGRFWSAADGLYFPGVAVEIRHRGSYSHCLPLSGQHAGGLVPPMGDVDDFHSESYAWRKWRGRVDVPPLLCRFPARCLSSHPCRHALARHLLLPFPGDGHPGLAEMDC